MHKNNHKVCVRRFKTCIDVTEVSRQCVPTGARRGPLETKQCQSEHLYPPITYIHYNL